MDVLSLLIRDSRFWLALYALVQAILFYFAPDFPQTIWMAIDALIVVVIGIITGKAAVAGAQTARAARAMAAAQERDGSR
jgi:hypothetical protein